ncbi:MAG: cystathionine gamma-synthase [Planctomycetota bacterium]
MRFGTRAIHAGQEPDPTTGAVMTPVYMTSTYVQEAPAEPKDGHDYTRAKNPTRTALERNLASLEGGVSGHAFSSGLAAVSTVLQLLEAGDHVVAGNDLYGGTRRLFEKVYARHGIRFTFVDPGHPEAFREALRKETRLIWVESPSNPLLTVVDLEAVAALGKRHSLLLACDNTFATPYLQNPLDYGFDLVAHSLTKYLGGHSDLLGGALVAATGELSERISFLQLAVGALPGPMDCFLTLRGIKTLHLRMERHCRNAERVVEFLSENPRVRKIHYPGLEQHPNHAVAARQMRGYGGMVSFVLDASVEEAKRVVTRTRVFALAESLGGVESLIEHPPSMTHASITPEQRRSIGIDDGLIRLSVGVEDAADLLEDLDQALAVR